MTIETNHESYPKIRRSPDVDSWDRLTELVLRSAAPRQTRDLVTQMSHALARLLSTDPDERTRPGGRTVRVSLAYRQAATAVSVAAEDLADEAVRLADLGQPHLLSHIENVCALVEGVVFLSEHANVLRRCRELRLGQAARGCRVALMAAKYAPSRAS